MVPSRQLVRVLILYNPVAGSGRASLLARELMSRLDGVRLATGGILEVHLEPTQADRASVWLDPVLQKGFDVLVVVGGDGACRLAAPSAIRTGVSLYHYPSGTENLFARDHGMRPDPRVLLEALEHGTRRSVDAFRVQGEWGLICASIGFDAWVVRDLAANRSGAITHRSYLGPILGQLCSWRGRRPTVRVVVDGDELFSGPIALALAANSSQYGMRLDPAPDALLDDGMLDVVVLPARTLWGVLVWSVRCRLRNHLSSPRIRRARGACVVFELDEPAPLQIDGDPPRSPEPIDHYRIEIHPGAVKVLVPPSENRSS
ncbi:MAG: diacylglycerol kinase family protein [Planctomycetota bacterium]|nr:diacylglycerol kinase family protein [Planctomycetota bacterium]